MTVPQPICDSHAHVFGTPALYPLARDRRYLPGEAPVEALREHLARVGAGRVVLVQPSVYGDRHECMINALQSLGACARGVAAASLPDSPSMIETCRRAGVVALRVIAGARAAEEARRALERAFARALELGWHVELQAESDMLRTLLPTLSAAQVPVVIEHCGLLANLEHPVLRSIETLLSTGNVWVKLAGLDRLARRGLDPQGSAALVRRLVAAGASRAVWGSDWPHTPFHGAAPVARTRQPFREVPDGEFMATVAAAGAACGAADAVLRDNAAALYGFL